MEVDECHLQLQGTDTPKIRCMEIFRIAIANGKMLVTSPIVPMLTKDDCDLYPGGCGTNGASDVNMPKAKREQIEEYDIYDHRWN